MSIGGARYRVLILKPNTKDPKFYHIWIPRTKIHELMKSNHVSCQDPIFFDMIGLEQVEVRSSNALRFREALVWFNNVHCFVIPAMQ